MNEGKRHLSVCEFTSRFLGEYLVSMKCLLKFYVGASCITLS